MNYSKELKESILRRLLPPNSESVSKVAKEEGLPEQTLRTWLKRARKEGHPAPGKAANTDEWSTQDKFLTVVETASLNEAELAEYARKKGLYVEQIKSWRDACMNANGGVAKEAARLNQELKESEKERKKLEKRGQVRVDYVDIGIKPLMPSELLCRVKERSMYETRGYASITRHNTPT